MQQTAYSSLSHSKWGCNYHLVFIPKYRRKVLYGKIRTYLAQQFHELANQKGYKIIEGHMVQDHVHMLISIPPKYSVSEIVGYIKGKKRQDSLETELVTLMARGYAISIVGFNKEQIRAYVRDQEQ